MTIQELQAYVDTKPDQRELINVIVDYLQSNAGGGGGSQGLQDVIDENNVLDKSNQIMMPGVSIDLIAGDTTLAGDASEFFQSTGSISLNTQIDGTHAAGISTINGNAASISANNSIGTGIIEINGSDDSVLPRATKNGKTIIAYDAYTVLMSQSAGSDPTIDAVFQNDLGSIIWTRISDGVYNGTLAGAFPVNKTFITPSQMAYGAANISTFGFIYCFRVSDNVIQIETYDDTYTPREMETTNLPIEIRIYS